MAVLNRLDEAFQLVSVASDHGFWCLTRFVFRNGGGDDVGDCGWAGGDLVGGDGGVGYGGEVALGDVRDVGDPGFLGVVQNAQHRHPGRLRPPNSSATSEAVSLLDGLVVHDVGRYNRQSRGHEAVSVTAWTLTPIWQFATSGGARDLGSPLRQRFHHRRQASQGVRYAQSIHVVPGVDDLAVAHA